MMKRYASIFGAGAATVLLLAGGGVIGWLLMDKETRAVVLVGFISIGAAIIGIAFALAFVGVVLLKKLAWSVETRTPNIQTVVAHGLPAQPQPAMLPPPAYQDPPPASWRPTREWMVLGADAQRERPKLAKDD